MVLSGRMAKMSRIALIFPAKQTAGIAALLRLSGLRDVPRVLFRLGKIDGNVNGAVFRLRHPFFILCDPVPADIVGSLAESIVIV